MASGSSAQSLHPTSVGRRAARHRTSGIGPVDHVISGQVGTKAVAKRPRLANESVTDSGVRDGPLEDSDGTTKCDRGLHEVQKITVQWQVASANSL